MSNGKNQRTKDRRHRRMEEARSKVHELSERMNKAESEEEKAALRKEWFMWLNRSTRKANQL
jgi:hypothetical protein